MLMALILSVVMWSSPAPTIWVCNPGHGPLSAPSNCEPLRFHVLTRFWVPGPRVP